MNWLHVAAPRPTILAVRAAPFGSVAALGVKGSASNAQQRIAHRTTRSASSVTRRRLLPAHFLKVATGFKIGPLLLEFCLPRLPLRGLDRKCNRGASGYRIFRLALQRVLALRREGDRLAGRAPRNEHRTDIALGRYRLRLEGFEDVDGD